MNIISLAHERALRYPSCNEQLNLDEINVENPLQTTLITFARAQVKSRRISALDRMQDIQSGDVVLSYFDTTPLYAQLLWDIAHSLSVGCNLYLNHSNAVANLLLCSYYRECFDPVRGDGNAVTHYKKKSMLPIESERGLDNWSFCIPTDNGDPAILNTCIERILALGIPNYEIILCGRPRSDFLFWSHVRIVGEDIPASLPIHITRKKNILAAEAKFSNLCILHDRVLLSLNFMDAVRQFGDDFPFTGFQSYWFADRWQAVPQRYSDAGVITGIPPKDWSNDSREQLNYLSNIEFRTKHPKRADFGQDYLTGSLYLCKRSVWQLVPQNENLYWQEYEDLDQAFRGAVIGIPSRINPFSLTSTLRFRSALLQRGILCGDNVRGVIKIYRPLSWLCGFPRRPALAITEEDGLRRMEEFSKKYVSDAKHVCRGNSNLSGVQRYLLIARLLWMSRGDLSSLPDDIHRYLLCEAPVPHEEINLAVLMQEETSPYVRRLALLLHPAFLRQMWNNPFSSPFLSPKRDSGIQGGWRLWFGSFVSAVSLKYFSPHTAFQISFLELWKLIVRSAPVSEKGR